MGIIEKNTHLQKKSIDEEIAELKAQKDELEKQLEKKRLQDEIARLNQELHSSSFFYADYMDRLSKQPTSYEEKLEALKDFMWPYKL